MIENQHSIFKTTEIRALTGLLLLMYPTRNEHKKLGRNIYCFKKTNIK